MARLNALWAWMQGHRWISGGAAVLLILLLALGAVRVWINSDRGRDYVLSQINGRDVAGYGVISAEGLRGDPLSDIQLRSLKVSDAKGAWIEADEIRVVWHPFRLAQKQLDLDLVSASEIRVLRRPERAEQPPKQESSSSIAISLDTLKVARLALSEGVAGEAAAFSINADASRGRKGSLTGDADIIPLEGRGDRLALRASAPKKSEYQANAELIAPAGGVIATLLKLPADSSASVTADLKFEDSSGSLNAVFLIDERPAVHVDGSLKGDVFSLNAVATAAELPLPQRIKDAASGQSRLQLDGTLRKKRADFTAALELGPGNLSASGLVDTEKRALVGPLNIVSEQISLNAIADLNAAIDLNGKLAQSGEGFNYDGALGLTRLDQEALPFSRVAGDVDVSYQEKMIDAAFDLIVTDGFQNNEQLSALLGPAVPATGGARYDVEGQTLELADVRLTLTDGSVVTTGRIDLSEKTLDLSGTLNQQIATLRPDYSGRVSGSYSVTGEMRAPLVSAKVSVNDAGGLPPTIMQLLGPRPSLDTRLSYSDGALTMQRAALAGAGLQALARGTFSTSNGADITVTANQSEPVLIADTEILLDDIEGRLTGPIDALRLSLKTRGGRLQRGERMATDTKIDATLRQTDKRWTGDAKISAEMAGSPFSTQMDLNIASGEVGLENITGSWADLTFSGMVAQTDANGLKANVKAEGAKTRWETGGVEGFDLVLNASQPKGGELDLAASLNAKGIQLNSGLQFETLEFTANGTQGLFDYKTKAEGDLRKQPFDTNIVGTLDLTGEAPTGIATISGTVFEQPIKTNRPLVWRLGDRPQVELDVLLLGGEIDLSLTDAGDKTELTYVARDLEIGPLLVPLGLSGVESTLSGRGDIRPYGLNPTGSFTLAATSPIPGLDTSLDLDIAGAVSSRGLQINGKSLYGKDLRATAQVTVPISTRSGLVASVEMEAPLTGTMSVRGNLGSAREAALAFGHDIGGAITLDGKIAGSLKKPELSGTAKLVDGIYEFGATGMRVKNLNLDARYGAGGFALSANGQGASGGSISLDGRSTESGPKVNVALKSFPAFEQRGDIAIVSGDVELDLDKANRLISGNLTVNRAEFSLDNLPQSGPDALDVRWEDAPPVEEAPKVAAPFALDLTVKADRQVYLKGRGFNGEWGADLQIKGNVAAPELYGTATLIRGDLDLVGRPFVFDRGRISFDGPVSRTTLDISAERSVTDLTTRVALTGRLAKPAIELTSTPDLPQDEILSRLLFGRASINLSAFEAAQLASTFRRLRGEGAWFDPAEELQSALGVDRVLIGTTDAGAPQIGVGQYIAEDVYLELNTAGAAGTSAEVEWQPVPQVSVTSETRSDGEGRISLRWKKDY